MQGEGGQQVSSRGSWKTRRTWVNTNALEQAKFDAERRVLEIQTKLHRWSAADAERRFDDLYNLVSDPAFLLVGWLRVRANKGARTGRGGRSDRPLHRGGARG